MFSSLFGRSRKSSGEARAMVAAGATLLDVRTPGEFAEGHVAGAVNIPVQELGARIHEVPVGRVVVYCRSGGRSATAATMLKSRGYDVLDIGPMSAW
jgi:phage shock protein E